MRHPAASKNGAHRVRRPPGLRSWAGPSTCSCRRDEEIVKQSYRISCGSDGSRDSTFQWLTKQLQSFRADARVTFFVAKKVTKENSQYLGKSAVGDMAGIFRCGILPRRKTAHIVCAALRVSELIWQRSLLCVDRTMTCARIRRNG